MSADALPTIRGAEWQVTDFLAGALSSLAEAGDAATLRLYFYAVTLPGWMQLADAVDAWRTASPGRTVVAYIGTDHALTDPDALTEMEERQVQVRLLTRYNGVYHPKLIWLVGPGTGVLLAGSNNLTLDGLKSNVEFALRGSIAADDEALTRWHHEVHASSDPLSSELLETYASEREAFGNARARAKVAGTFTWSRRSSAVRRLAGGTRRGRGVREAATPFGAGTAVVPGDLIVEVMPLETGTGGSQVQIPMVAARSFFNLPRGAIAQVDVNLRNTQSGVRRALTLTRFPNATSRLVIAELQYRDRPCVLHFHRTGAGTFDFEIVREAIDPDLYRNMIAGCSRTRTGSKRWAIVPA